MNAALQRIQEERASCWNRMTEIVDGATREERDLTPEERTNWDAADKRLTELTTDKDRLQRQEVLDAEARSQGPVDPPFEVPEQRTGGDDPEKRLGLAFDTFMRRGLEGIDSAEDRALVAARYSQSESRAEGVATGSAGGYLVPQGFWQNLVIAMKAYGGLINLATIIETSTGNPLPWPSTDDTSNLGSILGENVQVSGQDIAFTNKTLNAYTYTSNLVLASLQLMQDSAFDLDSFITGRLSERIGRAVAQHLVNGTGTAQPQGVLASGAVTNNTTLPTGNTVKLTYAGLVALSHSIDPAYRASGNARFLMSDAALSQVRQIVDGQGRPLWTPDYLGQGDRDVILGYPVTIDQSVPVPAANAISVVFGDFKAGYVVRRALGLQLLRLTERYADFLQVGFIGFMRLDGKVNDPRALATLTQSGT
jgi:HK97 family phage major capsid protein